MQWPDPSWLHPDGYQGQDVPVVENQGQPPAGLAPPFEGPPEELQGSPPAPRPVNPDPYLAQADRNSDQHAQALIALNEAEQQRNDFLSSEGVANADRAAKAQGEADRVFMQVQDEAKAKRAVLDKEAQDIANQNIDPRRAWHDASFGAKLAIGVTAFLQGYMNTGKAGAQNTVMSMVDSLCEQDQKSQEEALARRVGGLATRRGLLADDVAAGRDVLDFKYKSLNAAYSMAENQIKAYALKYDNPVINAQAQEKLAEINDARLKLGMDWHQQTVENGIKKRQVDIQGYEARTGRMSAETARLAQQQKGGENSVQERRLALEEKKYAGGLDIRGSDGRSIGTGKTDKEAEASNNVVQHRKNLDTLYQEGKKLFADGWATPGTDVRIQQDTWNKNFAQERRMASGDTSAPNIRDQEIWGLDTSRMVGDNQVALDTAYENARRLGLNTLRHSGVSDEELKREGFIDPPAPPTPGVTDKRFYQDENGVNTEGRGTPLSTEENAAELRRRDKFEQTRTDPQIWKRKRYENNLHVQQRAQGPLPWPDVGTGPID